MEKRKLNGFTLAEVLMANKAREKECLHSLFRANEPKEPSNNIKKLVAFTLAEVLITLAIIGVVAALTIPTLVTSYQKKMYVTQLKKSYNNLTNGFKTIMAQDGVLKLEDTVLWAKIPNSNVFSENLNSDEYKDFLNEFKKTFKVLAVYGSEGAEKNKVAKYLYLNGDDSLGPPPGALYLADGSFVYLSFYRTPNAKRCNGSSDCASLSEFQEKYNTKTKLWNKIGEIIIDINGLKGPNIMGRDLFQFSLGNDGTLYPIGGADDAVYDNSSCGDDNLESCDYYWKNQDTHYGCSLDSDGSGCAGRIMEEGWKMNY